MLPKTVDIVIAAGVSLHNFVITEEEKNGEKVYNQDFLHNDDCMCINIQWFSSEQDLNTGTDLAQRDLLCHYLTTFTGKVEWQDDFVKRGLHTE